MNNSREDLLAPIRSKLSEDLVRADVIMVKVRSRTGQTLHPHKQQPTMIQNLAHVW